ncbi:hypothetical protein [Fusobacterium mortiferum]|uniref:hypothetical protein n=1 Tax=Fusobacterium mortiferum TaxID=850 RepID=UPI0035621FAD
MNKASVRSKKKLEGVDSRLVLLVGYALAISPVDFFVNEGVRSEKKTKRVL